MTSSDEALFQRLAGDGSTGFHEPESWELVSLLADYLACVLGSAGVPRAGFSDDGVAGLVSVLALRAGALDRDDVDWTVLTHPGAVVWSTALPVAAAAGADGATLARAACLGYRATATMARVLGAGHRARWHATATAGGFGAAAAAGCLVGLTEDQQVDAFAHTAAATGGLGQAALERRGAGAYNRAGAAARGLHAVRAAQVGAVPVHAPLTGERGLLALASDPAEADAVSADVLDDGIAQARPRLFPVSGFGQAAVLATVQLRAQVDAEPRELVVEVAEATAVMMDRSAGGAWWSLTGRVAAAWASGDAFSLAGSEVSRSLESRVTVRAVPGMAVGGARVRAVTAGGTACVEQLDPASLEGVSDGPVWLSRKWSAMVAAAGRPYDVVAVAEEILRDGANSDHIAVLRAS